MRSVKFTALMMVVAGMTMMAIGFGVAEAPSTEGVPIIQVETPAGPATISGPGAEWLLETGFPIVWSD